jgi:hypothetical protein
MQNLSKEDFEANKGSGIYYTVQKTYEQASGAISSDTQYYESSFIPVEKENKNTLF